jgi:hypothetical protein
VKNLNDAVRRVLVSLAVVYLIEHKKGFGDEILELRGLVAYFTHLQHMFDAILFLICSALQ